jgi:hypothetical protein
MNMNMNRRPSIRKISSAIKSYSASLSMPKHSYLSGLYSYRNDSALQSTQNCNVMLDLSLGF